MRYPVTITPDDGQFTVTFPDVPEAVTFGETRDEALRRSPDALLTIFDAFMKDRRDIPVPSATSGQAIELSALESAKIELYQAMRATKVGKAELAKRLRWHLPQVDRVLHVRHGSQLSQMENAFAALGKKLVITVIDSHDSIVTHPRDGRAGDLPSRSKRLKKSGKRRNSRTTRHARSAERHAVTALAVTGRRTATKKR